MKCVTIFFMGDFPGTSAGAKRVGLYQNGLLDAGYECRVLATGAEPPRRLKRLAHLFSKPAKDFWISVRQFQRGSCVVAYGGRWSRLIAILIAARLRRAKFILEVNEKPYSPYGNRISEIKFVKSANRRIFELLVLPLCDGFVVISKPLECYIERLKARDAKLIRIPILVDSTTTSSIRPQVLPQPPFVLHAGALSEQKDGVLGMLQAIADASRTFGTKLHVYFTDDIAPKVVTEKMKAIIEENGMQDSVHFIGHIPEEELKYYQLQSAMLILFKPDNEQNRYNFSTKLGEYLVIGKPVLYTPVGEMAGYLEDKVSGYQVAPGDIATLTHTILSVLMDQDQAKKIGERGQRLAEREFDYRAQGRRLGAFLEDVAGKSPVGVKE